MRTIFTILITFFIQIHSTQAQEELLVECVEKNVKTKSLKRRPKLTIRLDSLEIAGQPYPINFQFSGKIKTQTGLLRINDTLALNVILLRLKIAKKDEYFHSHTFYRKQNNGQWQEVSAVHFDKLFPGSYTDGWGGIGYRGDQNSFWYKMYFKFE